MNILFLNASPRLNGYTVNTLKCIEKSLSPNHTVKWVHANNLNMKPCQGCLACRPNKECRLSEDDGHRVARLIRNADALVVGSPTYFGNVTGPFRTLIDRSLTALEEIAASCLEMPIPLHKGKNAAMVTACATPKPFSELPSQATGAITAMTTTLNAGGYNIVGSIIVDGSASLNGLPHEVQQQAKQIATKLEDIISPEHLANSQN